MTISFEEAEKIRAEYRKALAEKDKPKKETPCFEMSEEAMAASETKAESSDESVSSSKSEGKENVTEVSQASAGLSDKGRLPQPQTSETPEIDESQDKSAAIVDKPKKKRGRPKKKKAE